MEPLCAILTTHTARHLRQTLLGVACQTRKPDRVVVSCDNDSAEVLGTVRDAAREFGTSITLVRRPFTGNGRSGQVRNNAVRALEDGMDNAARLVFLDGDCCPAPDALGLHAELGGSALVLGFRVDLSPEQTEAFSEEAIRAGRMPVEPTPEQMDLLATRDWRYRRQRLARRLGIGKSHKPKLLSANFSVPLSGYKAINGFDETYEGYGQEDDDFGRRWYRAIGLPVVAVSRILAFHLYHPTRAPGDWHESPNAARFAEGEQAPAQCRVGLDNAMAQGPLDVQRFG